MWLFLATFGYLLLAVVVVFDKMILTREVPKPILYTFYSTIFMLGAFVFYPFGVRLSSGFDLVLALISGLGFGFGLLTLFQALKSGEATHIHPFNGAVVALATFLLGHFFLQEKFTLWQGIGIIILIFASILLSIEKSHYKGIHRAFLWAAISGILFAISHVSAKYLYGIYPFFTAFLWTKGTAGIVGLLLLLAPSVRASFHPKKKTPPSRRHHPIILTLFDKILGIVAVVLLQYAIAKGSVTIVNALAGVQFMFIFFLVYFLTHHFPKVLKEYFTRREVQFEIAALLLLLIGVGLLVI